MFLNNAVQIEKMGQTLVGKVHFPLFYINICML